MRRQLAVLVVATTSLVLIAFLVPLGYLVRQVAADRAVNAATQEAEGLAPVVATVDRQILRLTMAQVAQDDPGHYPLTVFLPDDTVLGAAAPRTAAVELAARGRSIVVDTGEGIEIVIAVQGMEGGTAVVRSFVAESALWQGVVRAWSILVVLGLVLLALSVLVADRLAHALVQPMSDLADVSHRLASGDLDARVRPSGPVELTVVGQAVNHLAGRIGELLTSERESVADLAHRLRTPLTALRLEGDALKDPAEAASVSARVDSLTRAVNAVIHEARRPVREGVGADCDVAAVVRERLNFWSALAEEEGRDVSTDVATGRIPVRVSEPDLSAALDALLGNVFAHTPPGTPFAVKLRQSGPGIATLTVSDEGPGFDVSDPFERGHSAADSTGLGLDIIRRTAEATGGYVSVESATASSAGARIILVLGSDSSRDEG